MNPYQVLSNYPDKFSKIVLHLGDFRFMEEIFTMPVTLVKGTGFEDVIFKKECAPQEVSMEFYLILIIIVAGLSLVSWEKR